MPSAGDLKDEALRLFGDDPTGTLSSDSIEEVLEALRARLYHHPEEVHELGGHMRDGAHTLERTDSSFSYRNVALSWAAEHGEWRWPPSGYGAYEHASRDDEKVHVLGECWGMSAISHPPQNGRVLLTGDPMNLPGPRVKWGNSPNTVTCLLGATWNEVHQFLNDNGNDKNLANQPGFSGLTVIGNIGTGGHGSSLGTGPLAQMVTEVRIASVEDPDKTAPTVFKRGTPEFELAVTHLGRLGPVVSMDVELRNPYRIAETRTIEHLGGNHRDWKVDLEALVMKAIKRQESGDVHSAEIWLAPYADKDGRMTAALGIREITKDKVDHHATRPAVLRSKALQALGEVLAIVMASLHPSLIRKVLRGTVEETETDRVVMEPRDGLDFGAPNVARVVSIEMALDLSDPRHAVAGVISTIEELERLAAKDHYLFSPLGIRFVGKGPSGGLAPQAARDRTLHLEIPTFAAPVFGADSVLRPLQILLAETYGARPHWGQRVYLTPAQLLPLWPKSSLDAMAAFAKRLDPKGRFTNPLLDPLLGI